MRDRAGGREGYAAWVEALERRHRQSLTFPEVRRGLQALSSLYVERRGKLATGAALEGAGKRAAFALYYGPAHFLLVRAAVRALGAGAPALRTVLDLGCGTGAAGAAWALEAGAAYEGFTVNELDLPSRDRLLSRLLEGPGRGVRVLVVEPLARRLAPWWDGWERGFTAAGGRADQWRLEEPLPETVALLGRAAGLDPTAVGARSLFLPARDR